MAMMRARIKDHIIRGNMTEEEALKLEKKGFKDRNMYITLPEKSDPLPMPFELNDEKKTGRKK